MTHYGFLDMPRRCGDAPQKLAKWSIFEIDAYSLWSTAVQSMFFAVVVVLSFDILCAGS